MDQPAIDPFGFATVRYRLQDGFRFFFVDLLQLRHQRAVGLGAKRAGEIGQKRSFQQPHIRHVQRVQG